VAQAEEVAPVRDLDLERVADGLLIVMLALTYVLVIAFLVASSSPLAMALFIAWVLVVMSLMCACVALAVEE